MNGQHHHRPRRLVTRRSRLRAPGLHADKRSKPRNGCLPCVVVERRVIGQQARWVRGHHDLSTAPRKRA